MARRARAAANEPEPEDIEEEDDDLAMDMYDDAEPTGPLFWSMKLEPGKTQEIDQPAIEGYIVHVTNACFGVNVQPKSRTVVMVNTSSEDADTSNEAPICVLRQGQQESHPLDLLFNESATMTLKGQKPSEVYLTGYLQPPVEADQDAAMSMLEDADEEEIQRALARQKKLGRVLDDEDDEEDEEAPELTGDAEEEEDEEEQEAAQPPNKKQKTAEGPKATKNGGRAAAEQQKRKSPQQKPKKAPQDLGKEEDTKVEEMSEEKADKKEKKDNSNKKKDKKMQNMKGGIKYRDMKIGDGKQLSIGDKVKVYYVGQTDDKQVFDKCLSGPGFEFNLGKGDVIKGWDQGLKGMRVGGKRKLVIPPKMGYGASGSPPSIPPNATLTFTIEVKGVNGN